MALPHQQEIQPGEVVVRIHRFGLATEIETARHSMRADEPVDVGGTDTGPSPYGYLLAALGACTCMTLRLYADRKKWPLESVEVRLTHDKRYAEDCANCDDPKAKIDHISRAIALAGPLDAEQKTRLLEIADKCPVHRTLHGPIRVETVLA